MNNTQNCFMTGAIQYQRYPIDEFETRRMIQSKYNKIEDGIIPSSQDRKNNLYIQQNQNKKNKHIVQSKNFQRVQNIYRASDSMFMIKLKNREYMITLFEEKWDNFRLVIYIQARGKFKKIKTLDHHLRHENFEMLVVHDEVFIKFDLKLLIWKLPTNQFQEFDFVNSMAYVPKYDFLALIMKEYNDKQESLTYFMGLRKLNNQLPLNWQLFKMSKVMGKKARIKFDSECDQKVDQLITSYQEYDQRWEDRDGYWCSGIVKKFVQYWVVRNNEIKFLNEKIEIYADYDDSYGAYFALYLHEQGIEYIKHNRSENSIEYNYEKTQDYRV